MVLSEYYEDKTVISTLRSFFDVDEQYKIDFKMALASVEDYDNEYYKIKVKNRAFLVHKIHCGVMEVTE